VGSKEESAYDVQRAGELGIGEEGERTCADGFKKTQR